MIRVLRDQYVGQQTRTGAALVDGPRRQGRLVNGLTANAGPARAMDAVDHEAAGNVFQLFRHVLAQGLERAAALAAGSAGRQFLIPAFQVLR